MPEGSDLTTMQPDHPIELRRLLALSEDALLHIGRHLLLLHPPSAMELGRACSFLHNLLRGLATAAEQACRIRWNARLTVGHVISQSGLELKRQLRCSGNPDTLGATAKSSGTVMRQRARLLVRREAIEAAGASGSSGTAQ